MTEVEFIVTPWRPAVRPVLDDGFMLVYEQHFYGRVDQKWMQVTSELWPSDVERTGAERLHHLIAAKTEVSMMCLLHAMFPDEMKPLGSA